MATLIFIIHTFFELLQRIFQNVLIMTPEALILIDCKIHNFTSYQGVGSHVNELNLKFFKRRSGDGKKLASLREGEENQSIK